MRRRLAKDLRTRLAIFYSALLAAALVLYAICVSAFYWHSLHEQMDASLDRDIEAVEGDLLPTSQGQVSLTSHEGEADEDEDEDEVKGGYFLEVLGTDGAVLYRSDPLNGQALGPPSELKGKTRSRAPNLGAAIFWNAGTHYHTES